MLSREAASHSLSFLMQIAICVVFVAAPALSQTPVGYWPFDDGTGTKATDASGNGHTATLANGLSWVPGKIDGAVSANAAAGQHVSIPAINLSSTKAVTVALWVNRTYSTSGGQVLFEATSDYNHSTTGFALLPDDDTCQGIRAGLRGDVGYSSNCYSQPSSGVWHHLAVVFDKSQTGGNEVAFYVDGRLQTPNWSLLASTNTNNFGNNPVYLFSRGGMMLFDSGTVDDLRIYNTALTAAEIQQIYHSGALVSLAVTPASVSIPAGIGQRFIATGTYADGSQRDVTSQATWTSTASSVATMSRDGSAIGLAMGGTTIKATMAGTSGFAGVTVTAPRTSRDAASKQRSLVSSAASTGINLDVHGVHDNGSSASSTAAVSIGTPTAGDLITCEVTFDGHTGNALVSVSDNNNGSYLAAVPAHLNTTLVQWFGIYYRQAVAGSPTTVTLKTTNSQQWSAISCQAWKGVAISNSLDSGFVQSRDALSTANPTTGANKTPAGNGELVIAGLGLYSSGTPTAGANYNLIDSAAASQWWPEYWIQTTASPTAGNFIRGSDNFTDMMAAFKPAAVPSTFTIAAAPTSLSVAQGHLATSTITTTVSGGFSNAITLSASGVPSGTTANFSLNPIPAPGAGTSTLTITVGSSTAAGTYAITVTGSGGGIQQSTIVTLKVTASGSFTIAASPASLGVVQGKQGTSTITTTVSGGFSNAITLSASGVPSGTTANFSLNPIPAPGGGTSTLTLAVGGNTAVGTYPITVTGSGGGIQQSTTVTLTVTVAPNFAIAASPASLGVVQGMQGTSTITTTVSGGFSNAITLSASGIPAGTTASFSLNPIPAPGAGTSTLTIAVGSNTAVGTYPITVTGSGGGMQHTTTVTLTVAVAPNFAIAASPASLRVVHGNQGSSTITTTVVGGFNNAITLSASGVPAGTTVSFSSNPIPAPGAGSSSMTITVGSSTAAGTYPITVTGNGGGVQQTTTVNLTVAMQVALSWNATTSSGVAGYNAYRSTTSGGPYTKLNSGLLTITSYSDQNVANGSTYYYVTTAVDTAGVESAYSNQAVATVP